MNTLGDRQRPPSAAKEILNRHKGPDLSHGTDPTVAGRLHPLIEDPWTTDGEAEYGTVRLERIAIIDRNLAAISAIARMLANGVAEPSATGGEPLNPWTITSLLGGIESMCGFSMVQTEEMRSEAIEWTHE